MESPKPTSGTRRLLTRMLHPTRRWDASSDERLRQRVSEVDGANNADRDAYRRTLVAHRLLVGAPTNTPTRVEDDRRLDALLERFSVPETVTEPLLASPTPHPRRALNGWWGLFGAAAAALLLVVVLPSQQAPRSWQGSDSVADGLAARGAPSDGPVTLVGFGVTGVTETGQEYEVAAGDGAFEGDYLRFSYTNDRPTEVRYLFLLGLQPASDGTLAARWYVPEPEELRSVAVGTARTKFFDFETRLAIEHQPGPLRFVGIFTAEPLTLSDVAQHLRDLPVAEGLGPGFESWLRTRLGLAASTVVQVTDTTIRPGTHVAPSPSPSRRLDPR